MSRSSSISSLHNRGFSFIESFFSRDFRHKVLDFAKSRVAKSDLNSSALLIDSTEIYLPEECSYSAIRNISRNLNQRMTDRTVIFRRMDSSDGVFIDIINPDFNLPALRTQFLRTPIYREICNDVSISAKDIEFHIYYTRSCIKPRSWHIDSQSVKIFTYLTDVDKRHGPYAYQLHSHQFHRFEFKRLTKPTEVKDFKSQVVCRYFDPKQVVIPIGSEGTSFISNQVGIHRGMNQEENKERFVLVVQIPWEPV